MKRKINAAIAITLRGSRVLICQRKAEDTFGNYWEFPGGKQEAGETLEACLQRELREELAIEAQVLRPLTPLCHNYPHAEVHLHPFICQMTGGEITLIECQAFKWVTADELKGYEFPPANESLLAEVAAVLGNAVDEQAEAG